MIKSFLFGGEPSLEEFVLVYQLHGKYIQLFYRRNSKRDFLFSKGLETNE